MGEQEKLFNICGQCYSKLIFYCRTPPISWRTDPAEFTEVTFHFDFICKYCGYINTTIDCIPASSADGWATKRYLSLYSMASDIFTGKSAISHLLQPAKPGSDNI